MAKDHLQEDRLIHQSTTEEFSGEPLDVVHWSNLPEWSPEEGVALSLGIDPRKANWATGFAHSDHPLFPEYRKRYELVLRHIHFLTDRSPLGFMLSMKQLLDFNFPAELKEAVKNNVEAAQSNSKAHSELKPKEHNTLRKIISCIAVAKYHYDPNTNHRMVATDISSSLKKNGIQVDQEAIEQLLTNSETPGLRGDRQTHLRVFLGMAMAKYHYKPKLKRQSAATNIWNSFKLLGRRIDEDTIRKWLKLASKEVDIPGSG
jgi:hypothetical protein